MSAEFLRAVFAFLALPGVVAFALPLWLARGGSRNPMYLSVLLVLLGWATGFGAPRLFGYALAVAIAFHLRVVFAEEPYLARTHGEAWQRYRERVRRWWLV